MSMNSDQVFDAIEEIAATSSKNEKQALVGKYINDDLFKRVVVAAVNPLVNYGMRELPEKTMGSDDETAFDVDTWHMLTSLADRKLTGNSAWEIVQNELNRLTDKSAELLARIIRSNLRAGFSDSTVNKAEKGLIPEFPYMRCSLPKDAELDSWPWATGVFSQVKADGMFANIDHETGGLISIVSRQGSPFPIEKFETLCNEIGNRLPAGFQYHGELEVYRDGALLERQIGNGILNSVLSGGDFGPGDVPHYKVWDAIPLANIVPKGSYEAPYVERLRMIASALTSTLASVTTEVTVDLISTRLVKSLAEAYAHAGELMKQGLEGTVVKHPKLTWKDGTSKHQVKLKLEFDVDLEVVGIVPGRVGTKNEGKPGSFACKTSDGKLRVDVTVKNEAVRARAEEYIGKIIKVTANDIHEPSESNEFHSLFLPRMAEENYRLDKSVADDLDRVYGAKEMAVLGKQLKEAA